MCSRVAASRVSSASAVVLLQVKRHARLIDWLVLAWFNLSMAIPHPTLKKHGCIGYRRNRLTCLLVCDMSRASESTSAWSSIGAHISSCSLPHFGEQSPIRQWLLDKRKPLCTGFSCFGWIQSRSDDTLACPRRLRHLQGVV